MFPTALFVEQAKIVAVLVGVAPTGLTVAQRVELRYYQKATILVIAANGSAGVAGAPVTLQQSQDVGGTAEKPVPFAQVFQNTDVSAGDTLTNTAVVNNTFTTDATANKTGLYVLEVRPGDLDADGGFGWLRVGFAAGAAAVTATVIVLLWPASLGGPNPPSAVAN